MWAYKSHYPTVTGFLNMHPDVALPIGPFRAKPGVYWADPGIYTHAAAQGNQGHATMLKTAGKAYDTTTGFLRGSLDKLGQTWEDFLEVKP